MNVDFRTPSNALIWRFAPASVSRWLFATGAVLLGIGLLTASAKINVPMWPVPMTMQTLVVLMIGMSYGARLGACTVAAYLMAGAFGLPVFAGTPERGLGLAYMVGPTGGYLVGFLLAAFGVGRLSEHGWGSSFWRAGVAMALGHVVIFAAGVAWLTVLFDIQKAIAVGLTPFLFGTVVKTSLAAALVSMAVRGIDRKNV